MPAKPEALVRTSGAKRWPQFCQIIGRPDLPEDPRFKTNGDRHANRLELAEIIGDALQTHTSAEWEPILNDAGIPCGPIHKLDEALSHPQVLHREMVVEREHPVMGTVRLLGMPVKLSETPTGVWRTPPLMGQHTDEILRELGLGDADLARLRADGVINSGQPVATGDD